MTLHDLPEAPSGLFSWRYQVGVDGRLSALFGTFSPRKTRAPKDAQNSIAVLEHGAWREVAAFPVSAGHTVWDVAPDEWCIAASARAVPGARNASVFHNGTINTFAIEDAVEHVQCDESGFWVGYFDESRGPEGLVRFSRSGEREFRYPGFLLDCYALNVTRDGAWSCPYTDFPIVAMSTSGQLREWQNSAVAGATALAVHGDKVVLVGGYEGQRQRVALLKLSNNHAQLIATTQLSDIFPGLHKDSQIIARGNCIYAIEPNQYRTCAIPDLGIG